MGHSRYYVTDLNTGEPLYTFDTLRMAESWVWENCTDKDGRALHRSQIFIGGKYYYNGCAVEIC